MPSRASWSSAPSASTRRANSAPCASTKASSRRCAGPAAPTARPAARSPPWRAPSASTTRSSTACWPSAACGRPRCSRLWSVAGFALGAATALMGDKAAMACTVAVEETIDEHYAHQAAALGDDEAELRATIEKFRAEEIEHKDDGTRRGRRAGAGLRGADRAPSRRARDLAIWLSTRDLADRSGAHQDCARQPVAQVVRTLRTTTRSDPARCPSTGSRASFRAGSRAGRRGRSPAAPASSAPTDSAAGACRSRAAAGCP